MLTNLVSHYEVLRKLGAGGMGEVFLAQDKRLGRKVALKLLPASYQYDPDRRGRFLREARAASSLRSPNVAAIYDIGEHDRMMFIAMEFVEGELLSSRIDRGPLNIYQAIDIAVQVAEALDEAHSLQIVHRDIKSSNIMLAPRSLVKVLDFGLAKVLSSPDQDDDRTAKLGKETAPGVILGTVAYMSPEQARGLDIDGRSDLFSLGVLLYEMLTGRQPFRGGTTGDLLVAILDKEPQPLVGHTPEIPASMQWIVSKALRKDRALRYQTARDFIIDLRSLKQGLDTQVVRPVSDADSGSHTAVQAGRESSSRKDLGQRARRRRTVDSIAVLPLTNSGSDPEIEYLSDGITESIINTLSRIPKLRVMARSTVFRYKGRDIDPRDVGTELNVRAVLTGVMRKHDDHLVIGAELVDVTDGSLLWGEQYTRKRSDLLTIQDEISGDISENLKLKLNSGERRRIAKKQTESAEAYELYLKGRYHWSTWSEAGLREAIAFYEQALAKDPNFALAYCGLGDAYGTMSYFSPDPAQAQAAVLKSKACANRAVELNESLAEAHLVLANIAHLYERDWPTAERKFKLALELNPNLSAAHMGYSLFLMDQCLFDEAIIEMEMALRLDPLSLPVNGSAGFLFYNAKRYDEAIARLRKALELDPDFQIGHQLLAACLERAARPEEAVREYLKMFARGTGEVNIESMLADAYAESGMPGFWRRFAEYASELASRRLITSVFAASIFVALEEKDEAFKWLERAFGEQAPALSHIKADPRFENLRTDPRFAELLRRTGSNG